MRTWTMGVAVVLTLASSLFVGCGNRGPDGPFVPNDLETSVAPPEGVAAVPPTGSSSSAAPSASSAAASTGLPEITRVTAPKWDWDKAPLYRGYFYADLNDLSASWDWVITGRDFGVMPGSVVVAPGGFKGWVTKWTDTRIQVRVASFMASSPQASAGLTITTASGRMSSVSVKVVPSVQTRVYGQCTWHAARMRLLAGLSIPTPTAYVSNLRIDASYCPASRDVLMFSGIHQVFVESVSRTVPSDDRRGTRTVRYMLGISQYNGRYDEAPSAFATTHEVRETYDARTGGVLSRTLVAAPKFGTRSADGGWR